MTTSHVRMISALAVAASVACQRETTEPLSPDNWYEHQALAAIREVYEEIEEARSTSAYRRETRELTCDTPKPDSARIGQVRTALFDDENRLRYYSVRQKDLYYNFTERERDVAHYYDSDGRLRDVGIEFWQGGPRDGGTASQQVVFVDEAGRPLWSWLHEHRMEVPLLDRQYGVRYARPWMLELSRVDKALAHLSGPLDCSLLGPPLEHPWW